jgi:periplasmic copper chaperone A
MNRTRATSRAAQPWARGAALAGLLAAGLLALAAAPAAAHVTITASTTAAGATAVVRMEVPHGCEGSATTALAVRMPEGVSELAADDTERWSAEAAGDSVTFHTDSPLPDALRDEVVFSVRLPDEAGAELVFPVVQRCQQGESAWTEVAADEASREALDMPAPVLVVTGADGSGATAEAAALAAGPGSGSLMTYGAAGALLVGCLASGAVLVMRRRRA